MQFKRLSSSSISIPVPLLAVAIALGTALVIVDGILIVGNRTLRERVRTLVMSSFAPVGSSLPVLTGHRADGSFVSVDVRYSAPLILLLFDQDCAVCDQNWKYWDRLIQDPQVERQVLLISAASDISPSYLSQHPALRRKSLLGISPQIVQSFNLNSIPQTILVNKGVIIKTWPSILSDGDVREITTEILSLSMN